MRFKVLVATKLRPTPSMYNTATTYVLEGTEFDSLASVAGVTDPNKSADAGLFLKNISGSGFIPRVYSGVTYLQEVVPVTPPSTEVYPVKDEITMSDGSIYTATNFVKE